MNRVLQKCSMLLSVLMLISCTACDTKNPSNDTVSDYADIILGEDGTDLNVKLKMTTHRTDLIADDPTVRDFQDYLHEFNAIYPNIEIIVEGITDYDVDMSTRIASQDWDICSIPTTVSGSELAKYFEPLCAYSALADQYEFIDTQTYDGTVYGIPSTGNVQGIVYNKKVWADAGITDIPETPDAFIDALKMIRDNTNAIPLYTNYASRWTMGAWDYYGFCGATGDSSYKNQVMPYQADPFSQTADRTGFYEVYYVLYQSILEGLVEDDPNDTNWELCKAMINEGEIGCMALGSWAVPQMQNAGANAEDIGYMPFPISVKGVQYASAAGDYAYGINKKSSKEKKLAANLFIKFMVEQSGYAYDQGGIPIVKGAEYPDVLADFQDAELIMDTPVSEGEADVFSYINEASGLNLALDSEHVIRVADAAIYQKETLDDIMNEWNALWSEAQQKYAEEQ